MPCAAQAPCCTGKASAGLVGRRSVRSGQVIGVVDQGELGVGTGEGEFGVLPGLGEVVVFV